MENKKVYHIEELHCPKCAYNIIDNLEKISFIKEVGINYDTKEITISSEEELTGDQLEIVLDAILSKGHCEEHRFNHLQNVITEEFNFEDIDCPNCALKVERALNKNEDILEAKVNFINKKIIITHLNNVEVYDIVSKIVGTVENGATIKKVGEEQNTPEEEKKKSIKDKIKMIALGLGLITFIVAIILKKNYFVTSYVLFIISYLLIGYDIIFNSIKAICHGNVFNENMLMLIASIGAIALNEQIEGILVILLYKVGEYYQDKATEKSKKAIKELMDVKTDFVMLRDGKIKNIKEVAPGDILTIKVGERVPLDGIVKTGETSIDMKTLTGESIPQYVSQGEEILSGSINLSRVIEVEVVKSDSDSTISKVLKMVEEASNQKSKTEKFITRFARIYTPCILVIALIIGLVQYFAFSFPIKEALNNVFTILVISCPCALVISIPLGYFAGIGVASSNGILVKGGNYLDVLSKADTFVFDKTGTITKGNFKVVSVNKASDMSTEEMLEIVARAEQYSLHPIAKSIQESYGKKVSTIDDSQIEEISGAGLKVVMDGKMILVGNDVLMNKFNISYTKEEMAGTVLYLSIDGEFKGSIIIADEIKENSSKLVEFLKTKKAHTVMLTGDSKEVAEDVASKVGLDDVKYRLLPQAKYKILKEIIDGKSGSVCYIGDGINDTPALRLADVGIAMGGAGSDSAKECADIVIMNDDLLKIKEAIEISIFTKKIVIQNIVFALAVKLLALILGATGVLGSLGMIIAVFADVGVCLIAIFNVLRISYFKKKKGSIS